MYQAGEVPLPGKTVPGLAAEATATIATTAAKKQKNQPDASTVIVSTSVIAERESVSISTAAEQ